MSKLIVKYKYWFVLAGIFIILRLPSLFEPYWYGDEGIYLTLGQAIRKGLTLYSQIHDNKPPTLYYLAAIFQTVFGFRLLLTLVMVPTIYFFYKLSLHFFSQKISQWLTLIFLFLTSIPSLEGNIANAEIFMLLPTIVGFLLFLESKKNIYFFLSGILLGLAFTIKVPVVIEFGFLFLWFILNNLKNIKKDFKKIFLTLLIFGLGFITPIFLFGIYFASKGVFSQFLGSALLQNFSYLSSWTAGSQSASVGSGGLFTRLVLLILYWGVIYFIQFKKIITSKNCFLLFWFGAAIFGVLLSTRPYPHYLIQLIPSFCLLIPFLVKPKKIFVFLSTIISFVFLFLIIKKYDFYFYPVASYYSSFYFSGSPEKFQSYFGSDVKYTYQVSSYINHNSNPDDRIFIWADQPFIYALSDRLPPGRYTVAYHIVDFNGYNETMSDIKTHLPKIIIYLPMENRPFEQLDEFISHYYYLDTVIGSDLIFKLR